MFTEEAYDLLRLVDRLAGGLVHGDFIALDRVLRQCVDVLLDMIKKRGWALWQGRGSLHV